MTPGPDEPRYFITPDLAYVQATTASGWCGGLYAYERRSFPTRDAARLFLNIERARLARKDKDV